MKLKIFYSLQLMFSTITLIIFIGWSMHINIYPKFINLIIFGILTGICWYNFLAEYHNGGK